MLRDGREYSTAPNQPRGTGISETVACDYLAVFVVLGCGEIEQRRSALRFVVLDYVDSRQLPVIRLLLTV
jgi:hypothetical protein